MRYQKLLSKCSLGYRKPKRNFTCHIMKFRNFPYAIRQCLPRSKSTHRPFFTASTPPFSFLLLRVILQSMWWVDEFSPRCSLSRHIVASLSPNVHGFFIQRYLMQSTGIPWNPLNSLESHRIPLFLLIATCHTSKHFHLEVSGAIYWNPLESPESTELQQNPLFYRTAAAGTVLLH